MADSIFASSPPKSGRRIFSPIGAKEYVVSDPQAFPSAAAAITAGDTVFYRPEFLDDERTKNHERIHVGQYRLERQPRVEQLRPIFKDRMDPARSDRKIIMETPAETFSSFNSGEKTKFDKWWTQQEVARFGKYMDLLKRERMGDRGIATIEGSIPNELLLRYIRDVAPPIRKPRVPGLTE